MSGISAWGLRAAVLAAFLRERPSHFLLGVVLAAVSIATATAVLWLQATLEAHATRQAQGIDIVVGAKGSALQNVLAAVYHVDVPNGNIRLAEVEAIAQHPLVSRVIPIALGDSVASFRIVGTTAEFLDLYEAQVIRGERVIAPFQVLLGAEVARATGLDLGQSFIGVHGLAEGGEEHPDHPYTVAGILAPTGRVIDRLVVTAIESVWLVHEGHTAATEPEATFALVQVRGPAAMASLPRALNAQPGIQAAVPALESARLLSVFAWVVHLVQAFALIMLAAALASLLGALIQAVARREPQLAVLQAMGARPWHLASLLLLEALVLALLAAGLAALVLSALPGLAAWIAPVGLRWDALVGAKIYLVVSALTLLAALLACLPALWRMRRLDVITQLSRA